MLPSRHTAKYTKAPNPVPAHIAFLCINLHSPVFLLPLFELDNDQSCTPTFPIKFCLCSMIVASASMPTKYGRQEGIPQVLYVKHHADITTIHVSSYGQLYNV